MASSRFTSQKGFLVGGSSSMSEATSLLSLSSSSDDKSRSSAWTADHPRSSDDDDDDDDDDEDDKDDDDDDKDDDDEDDKDDDDEDDDVDEDDEEDCTSKTSVYCSDHVQTSVAIEGVSTESNSSCTGSPCASWYNLMAASALAQEASTCCENDTRARIRASMCPGEFRSSLPPCHVPCSTRRRADSASW